MDYSGIEPLLFPGEQVSQVGQIERVFHYIVGMVHFHLRVIVQHALRNQQHPEARGCEIIQIFEIPAQFLYSGQSFPDFRLHGRSGSRIQFAMQGNDQGCSGLFTGN